MQKDRSQPNAPAADAPPADVRALAERVGLKGFSREEADAPIELMATRADDPLAEIKELGRALRLKGFEEKPG